VHVLPFTLCELLSRLYTKYLQLRILRLQYSAAGIIAAIVDITSILCALYCKLWAKYSAYPTVYAMWTVVPAIYKVFTAPLTEASIFSCRHLRRYCRYHDSSMRVILQTWCQIQRTSSSIRYMICGSGQIQSIYSSWYSGHNIQLNVSALQLEVFQHFDACYTANIVPNAAHILQFTLRELWYGPYTLHLQLRIFRLQYSSERICAAIVHITKIQCALYCILGAKYRAHSPVYAVWTVVPAIYKVFTAPHT
jgi:hypothetical protein